MAKVYKMVTVETFYIDHYIDQHNKQRGRLIVMNRPLLIICLFFDQDSLVAGIMLGITTGSLPRSSLFSGSTGTAVMLR